MSHPVPAVSHVHDLVEAFLPALRPAHQRGLAEWVAGTLAAGSGLEQAVLAALEREGVECDATRARLREVLCDGEERAAPCATSLEVEGCFAPLLAWVLAWWEGQTRPLAIDATTLREDEVVLSISVLYRSNAIPVAWVVLPHRGKGAWIPHLERLLALLAPAVPAEMTVLVMSDQGLWSPPLRSHIQAHGWHPLLRIRPDATFAPTGQRRRSARALVPGPGYAWVGEGVADKDKPKQLACTLVVVWGKGQKEPWLLLTDLPPEQVDGRWYGLRVWIALGFRALKSFGGDWQRTRRSKPRRIARHWLVLALATLLSLAVGTRLEEAALRGLPPGRLRRPHRPPPARPRRRSVFALGREWLPRLVLTGQRWWRALWLLPEQLPTLGADITLLRHGAPPGGL